MFGLPLSRSSAAYSTAVKTSFAVAFAAGAIFALAGPASAKQQNCYHMIKNEIPVECRATFDGSRVTPVMHHEEHLMHHAVRPVGHHTMHATAHVTPIVHHPMHPAHVKPIARKTVSEPLYTGSINRELPPSAARPANSPTTTTAGGGDCVNGYRWHATPANGDTLPMPCS
jgi:hypothetical protein